VTPTLAGAAWLGDKPLRRLIGALACDGEEARVVGGAVRNALLGAAVGDIDIATTALPPEVVRRVKAAGFHAVPTGIDHGTVTVIAEGQPFEVTTLRRDVETDGRHATVAFGRDWRADAERRDFTINALSADLDGTLHDPVGGLADIAARRVRFIGDPATRIREDYLRILRFFRFHAAYGHGAPDPAGIAACIGARDGLAQLSRERVRAELLKLLVAADAMPTLAVMADSGLLVPLLGGVPYLASAVAMARNEGAMDLPPEPMRRLGALAVAVMEDAERLWRQLRLSNVEHARLRAMADGWRRVDPRNGHAGRVLLYRLGPQHFRDRVMLAWSRAPDPAGGPWRDLATLDARWTVPVFPLKAADFLARGLVKGRALGVALRAAEAAWIAADFPADAARIAAIADAAAGGGDRAPSSGPKD
jgi:poly(A) polymerase